MKNVEWRRVAFLGAVLLSLLLGLRLVRSPPPPPPHATADRPIQEPQPGPIRTQAHAEPEPKRQPRPAVEPPAPVRAPATSPPAPKRDADEFVIECATDAVGTPTSGGMLFERVEKHNLGDWSLSRQVRPTLQGGVLSFDTRLRNGTGRLDLPGYVRGAEVRWAQRPDGSVVCDPIELVRAAPVVGKVNRTDGGRIFIAGCGGKTGNVNADGSFYLEVSPNEPCELVASWILNAGGQLKSGPPVRITPRVDEDTVVELELPDPP